MHRSSNKMKTMIEELTFFDITSAGHVVGYALIAYALYKLVGAVLFPPEIYGRHKFKKGQYEHGTWRRKHLDRYRAKNGHFPLPFPNGWYRLCNSDEVKPGQVLTVSALGREIVVFRGESGKIAVIDAFCPHLGTHLGHGGQVKGDNIVCPYHLWEFGLDGANKKIPYCPKDMTGTPRLNAKTYYSYESDELKEIFLWYHADQPEKPLWDLHPGLQEIEKGVRDGTLKRACYTRWDDAMMHVFEPSQNSADYFHFQTVHQYLPMPWNLKLIKADHVIKTIYGKEGTDIPADCMLIREKLASLKLFGFIPLPQFIAESIVTYVHIQGPENVVFKVDTPIGMFRAHFSLLCEEPFRQKACMVMYCSPHIPWILAKVLHWWIQETASQDLQVWEHKVHVKPRNLVQGDGPFAAYGKWLEQFYSPKSIKWDEIDNTLEW